MGWVQSIASTASFREFQLFLPTSSECMKPEHALANKVKTTDHISGLQRKYIEIDYLKSIIFVEDTPLFLKYINTINYTSTQSDTAI